MKTKNLVKGFVNFAKEKGWSVYIDWLDTTLPEKPNRQTATQIKSKIQSCDLFLFLATYYSIRSKWCPWEIGYADGVKDVDKILVIPTIDDSGNYHGNEYLQLYRRLEVSTGGVLSAWMPGTNSGGIAASGL